LYKIRHLLLPFKERELFLHHICFVLIAAHAVANWYTYRSLGPSVTNMMLIAGYKYSSQWQSSVSTVDLSASISF